MPELSDVEKVIDVAFIKYPAGGPFGSYVLRMRDLIDELTLFKDTMLQLGAHNTFLGPFAARLKDYDNYPTNFNSSSFKFFEHFFNERHDLNFEEMRTWCLTVVQFEEANEKRTVEAFKFLSDVNEYIEKKNGELIVKMKREAVEEREKKKTAHLQKKFEDEWKARYKRVGCDCAIEVKNVVPCESCLAVTNYRDTKSCDCYEYEMSGDCVCNFDV